METKKPLLFRNRSEVPPDAQVIEALNSSLRELFFVNNPKFKKEMPEAQSALVSFLAETKVEGAWVYFPWCKKVVHTLPEDLYYRLRTARNRNIINDEEQSKYRNISVGIAGLSVGSAVLSALVVSGGPRKMRVADFDTIEISNLNRINAKITDLGSNKAEVAARNVWELDPFAEIDVWGNGVSKQNLEQFISKPLTVDIFIDEIDSIDLKIMSRIICKKLGIPVLMATDNGDGIILDVERFDLEPDREIFHGLVKNDIDESNPESFANLDFRQWLKLATKIVGADFLTDNMRDSILQIGKTISAVPQLGTSAAMAGSAIAFVTKRIANKEEMPSGRYTLNLEEKLIPGYNDPASMQEREARKRKFLESFK